MKIQQTVFRIVVPIILLIASFSLKAQYYISFTTGQGQCYYLYDSANAPLLADSFRIGNPAPHNGTVVYDTIYRTLRYCPNAPFTGIDTFSLITCNNNNGTYTCQTRYFAANVGGCPFGLFLVQDSGVCAGGNRSFAAIHQYGGSEPFTYQWSDGSTGSSACEVNPTTPLCVIATDGHGCTATQCTTPASGCSFATSMTSGVCPGNQAGLHPYSYGGTPPYTYAWNNGETASLICDISPGLYTVTVTDSSGCKGTCIFNNPVSNYCSFGYVVDSNNTLSFTSHTDPNLTVHGYYWNFADNSAIDTSANPVHTFPMAGNYVVSRLVYYGSGDTCYYDSTIHVGCFVNVGFNAQNICSGSQPGIEAIATQGTPPYTYRWSNNSTTPIICGLSTGFYDITVTDATGCTGTSSYYQPGPATSCSFTYTVDSLSDTVTFIPITDTAHIPSHYYWDMGDGTYINGSNPVHLYNTNGAYYVSMNVYYTNGDSCSTNYQRVLVHDTIPPCTLAVTLVRDSTIACPAGTAYRPVVTGTSGGSFSYVWSNASTSYYSCQSSPAIALCVTVTDANQCSATACTGATGCSVAITLYEDTAQSCGNGAHPYAASCPFGTPPYTYSWNNGMTSPTACSTVFAQQLCLSLTDAHGCIGVACLNNSFINLQTAQTQCVYLSDSTYSVLTPDSFRILSSNALHGTVGYDSLHSGLQYCPNATFVGNDSLSIYSCQTINGVQTCKTYNYIITVGGCFLSVSLYQDSNICPGGNQSFAAQINYGGVAPYSYHWSDGSSGTSACQPAPNTPVTLLLSDAVGCTATATSTPNTGCQLLVLIGGVSPCQNHSNGLEAGVSNGGGIRPYTYHWSTGSTDSNLCSISPGVYFVTLTDAAGCVGVGAANITTSSACSFTYTIDTASGLFTFTSSTDPNLTVSRYIWYFSDSTTSTSANPTHTFAPAGYYFAFMKVYYTNGDSCEYDDFQLNNPTCNLRATIFPDECAWPAQRAIVASASFGTGNLTFSWSNGTNNPLICPVQPGNYTVTVFDGNNCSSTASYTVGNCYFLYTADSTTGEVVFTPYPDTAYQVSHYFWELGDSTTDTSSSPRHYYSAPNNVYVVTMHVYFTNGDSCSYTLQDVIPSNFGSTAYCQAFFYDYIDSVNTNQFHFFDFSSYNPVSWAWDFGDGSTATIPNPTHTYAAQGTYTVCLTTTDSSGCSSNYCEVLNNTPYQDMQAYLFHGSTVTPGFPVFVYLEYYNGGTIDMSGTITYRYPVGTFINATNRTIVSNDVNNRLVTFNYSNLYPGSSDYIYVELRVDTNLQIGTLAEDTMWVDPLATDITPSDNVSFINDSVTGSWDPNAKTVSPKGIGREGIVPMATKDLSYIIHFQNTGNGPANKVVLLDTLDNSIDLTTVQETQSSHDHVTQLVGNVLTVTFHNINLPDSSVNFAGSQGFIALHAKLKPTLPSGTRISNTASIYFDFNQPVVTNTVVTTLKDANSGIGNIQRFDFAVVPNPASSAVMLRGEFDHGAVYEVINQLGQIMMAGEVKANNTRLNISSLSGGVYLVKVISGDKIGIERLVIAR